MLYFYKRILNPYAFHYSLPTAVISVYVNDFIRLKIIYYLSLTLFFNSHNAYFKEYFGIFLYWLRWFLTKILSASKYSIYVVKNSLWTKFHCVFIINMDNSSSIDHIRWKVLSHYSLKSHSFLKIPFLLCQKSLILPVVTSIRLKCFYFLKIVFFAVNISASWF